MSTSSRLLAPAAATAALAALTSAAGSGVSPLYDSFDDGKNLGGWSYNPADVIESSGGNPGGWLHQPFAMTFAPIFESSSSAFAGDYRAAGVTKLGFDARTDHVDWGDGSGFEMSILLRDTKGTPMVDDDDYAYFVGPNVPVVGQGWVHYDFDIPSASTDPVPPGWSGGWPGDLSSFRPGIDWNDVITSVDQIEIWWINPSFFAILQTWDIGLDNIAFYATGFSKVRNGSGVNPLGFAETSPAAIGGTWDTTVDIATPGHLLSVVTVSTGGPVEGIFPGGPFVGELLVAPNFAIHVSTGVHSIPVPSLLSLLGASIATQGVSVAGDGKVHLNNALDVTVGS